MRYGWTGMILEIDLSRGQIEKKQVDLKLVETYLGGKGINAKLLWDRVPPEVHAFSPDNLLIMSAGLLTGTTIPGANRTIITYKSPVTDIHCFSGLGGFFGAELKHAGYDSIIISGKSPTPVYLWINNDQVEIRDARHLWGKDTYQTQSALRKELKRDEAQIICIGVAGENKVYHASIEHGRGASASRGGAGAIMGDKMLKAVAIYGSKDVTIANTPRLIELAEHILNRTGKVREEVFERVGYSIIQYMDRMGAYGNFSGRIPPELQQEIIGIGAKAQDFIDQKRAREVACANCTLRCKHAYVNPEGGYTFLKCGDFHYPAKATHIFDTDFAVKYTYMCEKYGLDVDTTVNCVALAIDLYQRGILTREDTDGMHLEWENAEVAFSLMGKMAHREGIGDILADSTYRAAQRLGRGAENYVWHTKKLDTHMLDAFHRPHICLIEAINDKGCMSKLNNATYSGIFPLSTEEKEAYLKDGWFGYPKEFGKYLFADVDYTGNDYEADAQMTAYDMDQYTLADATGICYFWLQFWKYPPINSRTLIADLISATTGMDIDEREATRIAKRIVSLVRAYNVREGIRRKDDRVPERLFQRPVQPNEEFIPGFLQRTPPPPRQQFDPRLFYERIDRFYEIEGWDNDGIPTKETLAEFGLDYVTQDLQGRGILTP